YGDRWFGSNPARELDKLIGSEVAGFQFVSPRCIDPYGTVVARTDAPFPVVVLRNVAARPANESGTQWGDSLFHIVADASLGIAWHKRNLIDRQFPMAGKQDGNFR